MCGADFTETAVEGDPGPCTGYELSNDIALSGSWTPIGGNVPADSENPYDLGPDDMFSATFDGNGYTISGLRISGSNKFVGLFGVTGSGSVIRNVGLATVNVRGLETVGALVGYVQPGGTVSRAWASGQVTGNAHVGGLVGTNRGTVEQSYSAATVTGTNLRDSQGPLWSVRIAGLVGLNYGTVRNAYATGPVRGVGHVAGLVGWNNGGGRVENSYATGPVTVDQGSRSVGGLVGWQTATVTNSYWDTETTGRSKGAGQGSVPANAGKTTAQLQKPTGASGIYHAWDANIWNFRTAIEYPCLQGVGDCGTVPATAPRREEPVDYDVDGDGLIEVRNQAQLNAIRWDMDGDARPDDDSFAGDYAAAFPRVIEGMCAGNPDPATSHQGDAGAGCRGYELVNDISLSGTFKPLGVDGASYFTAVLDGQGHVIRNLRVSQPGGEFDYNAGLFLFIDGEVRNLGLENVNVSGANNVGALAGSVSGRVSGVYSTGRVSGRAWVGGLAGELRGSIARSYSTASVSAPLSVGGLVGQIERGGRVSDSYAMGTVRATEFRAGGLVGQTDGSARVTNSYATGRVSAPHTIGGLAGGNVEGGRGTFSRSHWDTQSSGRNVGYGRDDWNHNNQHDEGEPQTGGITGLTTSELQSVTASVTGWSAAIWDFGTSGDYPCLLDVTPGCEAQTAQNQQAGVTAAVADDDRAGVTVGETELSIDEGGSATYTVVLDAQPVADVVIYPSGQGVTVQPASLTFTSVNWQTAQTVTVGAPHDADTDDEVGAITHSIDAAPGSAYANVIAGVVLVSILDDDEFEAQPGRHNEEEDAGDPEPADEPATEPDREVLEAFYESTGGASWTNNANWLSDRPLGEWHGVTVNGQGQVTHLSLRDNNLSGSLPAALGQLDALKVLSLDRNSIGGSLPAELGNLRNLTRLALNRNSLSGSIPSQLGNLSSLSIIGLARNQLSGSLPSSLGNLSGLTRLSLHDNTALSGPLPAGFVDMGGLQRLAIADTGLCVPSGDAFSDWLAALPDVPGRDGLTVCSSSE